MANLTENPVWETGVYQFEKTDYIEGGVDGNDNLPTRQLANRTLFLKNELEKTKNNLNGLSSNLTNRLNSLTLNDLAGANQAIANKLDIASFNSKINELSNRINDIKTELNGSVPIGTIMIFSKWKEIQWGNWHLCDGSPIDPYKYPELYTLLSGKLPDLTTYQRFIRCCKIDGSDSGVEQKDDIKNHSHRILTTSRSGSADGGSKSFVMDSQGDSNYSKGTRSDGKPLVEAVGEETRPHSLILPFYIKMK